MSLILLLDDPLVQTIYTFLEKPHKIPKVYPKLIPYLSRKVRDDIGLDISDSEEEREQDMIEGSQKENESINYEDSSYESSSSETDDWQLATAICNL